DLRTEGACSEVNGQPGRRVLVVVDRIDLDEIERIEHAGLGHELERKMHFAVGEAAAHRVADSGRDLGIDDVQIHGDVDERPADDALERLSDHRLHSTPVEVADRVDGDAELSNEL